MFMSKHPCACVGKEKPLSLLGIAFVLAFSSYLQLGNSDPTGVEELELDITPWDCDASLSVRPIMPIKR
jgi:hypothetical protein